MTLLSRKTVTFILCISVVVSACGINALCLNKPETQNTVNEQELIKTELKIGENFAEKTETGDNFTESVEADTDKTPTNLCTGEIDGGITEIKTVTADTKGAVASCFSRLPAVAKTVYTACADKAREVAAGIPDESIGYPLPYIDRIDLTSSFPADEIEAMQWSVEELGVDGKNGITAELSAAVNEVANNAIDASIAKQCGSEDALRTLILQSLICDMPNDLFWFDKSAGIMCGAGFNWSYSYYDHSSEGKPNEITNVSVMSIYYIFAFRVCSSYKIGTVNISDGNGNLILVCDVPDPQRYTKMNTSKQTADGIIAKYKNLSDLDKIKKYHDEVAAATSYDKVASQGGKSYGDEWQMSNVFDGDNSTGSVCEGYAKAFKYLCDNSAFGDKSAYCIVVTGNLYQNGKNLGGHMWNIIHLNGKNYLIDITNDDTYSADYLCMKTSLVGDISRTYLFKFNNSDYVGYSYDTDMFTVYTKDMLTLDTEYAYGDATLSKTVDVCDCVQILKKVKSGKSLNIFEKTVYDVNFDGNVNDSDALTLANIIAKNIPAA